ncbi:MAG TPA: hypothetical protein VGQ53_15820 [Chitinophagaceae bacterium]|jgi:hypothetical protein|nr:hypothetical protein [Chitinophagaceae bacterium]
MTVIDIILIVVEAYLALGLMFSIPFAIKGVTMIDPDGAKGTKWSFRVIIIPGTIVFWPLLLKKWINVTKNSK